jgi:hypothetical protein
VSPEAWLHAQRAAGMLKLESNTCDQGFGFLLQHFDLDLNGNNFFFINNPFLQIVGGIN